MIKSLHPLRLFLAAVIAVPWSCIPTFAEETTPPVPPTDEAARVAAAAYTPANFATDFAARPGTSNFERAFGYIPHLATLPPGPMRERQQALFLEQMSTRFTAPANFDASALLTSARTNPAAQRTLAMLYAASQDPQVHTRLMDQYNLAKEAAGGQLDFATFLTAMQTTIREATPGSLTSLDRIVMGDAAPRPPAPQRPGDPTGDGPGAGGPRGGTDFARTHWNPAEIYGRLGDPNVREVGGRTLAYNMVFLTNETGQMVPTLVVSDITNESNIRAFNIPLHASKDQGPVQFTLAGKSYSISLNAAGNDVAIVFPGAQGLPTAGALTRLAAEKVKANGYIVDVGGKEFFLGGQGFAGGGGNSFWTREMLNNLTNPNFNPLELKPEMSAASVRMEGGQPVPIPTSSIGQVNGKWYDMVWNPARGPRGEFEVKKGLPPNRNPIPGGETGAWRDLAQVGITPGTGAATDTPGATAAFRLNAQFAGTVTNARVVFSEGQQGSGVARGFWLMTKRDGSEFIPLALGDNPDAASIQALTLDGTAGNRHWLSVNNAGNTAFVDLRRPVARDALGMTMNALTKKQPPNDTQFQMTSVRDPELARYLMTQRLNVPANKIDEIIRNVNSYAGTNTNYAFHGDSNLIFVGFLNQSGMQEVYPQNRPHLTTPPTATTPSVTPGAERFNGVSDTTAPPPPSMTFTATGLPPGGIVGTAVDGTNNRIYRGTHNGNTFEWVVTRVPGRGDFRNLMFGSISGMTRYPTAAIQFQPVPTTLVPTDQWRIAYRPVPGNASAGVVVMYNNSRPPGPDNNNVAHVVGYWGLPVGDATVNAASLVTATTAARTP